MTTKNELYLSSTNGTNKLHLIIWEPAVSPIGILQISHGMIEYIDRYDAFAKYLNEHGFIVVGNDHLAHGQTVKCEDELGYFSADDPSSAVVNDLHQVTLYMKKHYPDLPYFLMGHSMGSFMARRYLMTYGNTLDGAIIMGTGTHNKAALCTGHAIVNLVSKFKSDTHRSKLLEKLCFGTYNLHTQKRTSKDWLSRDNAVVDTYLQDPLCRFKFTVNGYRTLFDTLFYIGEPENINRIPTALPIFMVAGDADPVGAYGKGVKSVYKSYKKHGVKDLSLKLYKDARHEILNEIDRELVYADIYNWLRQHLSH